MIRLGVAIVGVWLLGVAVIGLLAIAVEYCGMVVGVAILIGVGALWAIIDERRIKREYDERMK